MIRLITAALLCALFTSPALADFPYAGSVAPGTVPD
jgi:hypothetical protein